MPTYTPNYNLVKPLDTEFYNVNDQNSNMDAIDLALNTNKQQVESLSNSFNEFNENEYIPAIQDLRSKTQVATQEEAQTGSDNTKVMTPLRVNQAINSMGFTNTISIDNPDNTIKNGFYRFSHGSQIISGLPLGNYVLEVISYEGTSVQKFSLVNASPNTHYIRTRNTALNPVWTSVQKVLTQVDYNVLFQSVSNGKAQVAAAITGKGVTTAADATFDTLASNIGQINTGVKFASGTVQSSSTTLPFNYTDSTTSGERNYITVSSLGFIPKIITVVFESSSASRVVGTYNNFLNADASNSFNISTFNNNSGTTQVFSFRSNTSNAYVNDTGFRLPVLNANQPHRWWAYQ